MSAYGLYSSCSSKCLCPKCKLRGSACSPCMDCTGDNQIEPEDYVNGCITECDLFRRKEEY